MEEVKLGSADLEKMLSATAEEQLSADGVVFGSMDEIRARVTRQRERTVEELKGDSVVAPKSMNEHNPTTMQTLGIVTEEHEDTLAIRFVDARMEEDTAKLLSGVPSEWYDMMVIIGVGGHSRPNEREVSNAAKTKSERLKSKAAAKTKNTRLKSKAGLNASGIERHYMAEGLIRYKKTLIDERNPLHNLLPGFHKDSRFYCKRRPDLSAWSVMTQECWEWSAGQIKTKRVGNRGRGALMHFDTIGVRWDEHIEMEEDEQMCEATSAIGRVSGEKEAFWACRADHAHRLINWVANVRATPDTLPAWSNTQRRYARDVRAGVIPMPYQGVHSYGDFTVDQWWSMMRWGIDPRFAMLSDGDWYVIKAGVAHCVSKASEGVTVIDAWDEQFNSIDRANPLAGFHCRSPACGNWCVCTKQGDETDERVSWWGENASVYS